MRAAEGGAGAPSGLEGRVQSLFQIATRLGQTSDANAVAQVVLDQILPAVGAARCVIYECQAGARQMRMLGQVGLDPGTASRLMLVPLDAPLPLALAVRERRSLWLGTYEQVIKTFPNLRQTSTPTRDLQAVATLPLFARNAVVGGIGFSFSSPQTFVEPDRAFFTAIADLCAQALERAHLFASEAAARKDAEAALMRAQQSERRKDEFLAILGHELRNPLAPITTALQMLAIRGVQAKELAVVERQVNHLARLVDDLLDVSRITRGKIELQRQRLELAAVVVRAAEMAGPLIEQRRQKLTLDVPPEGLAVHGDPNRLAQIISNLLTNASKYSDFGSTIHVNATKAGDAAVLRVCDQGVGVEPEMLASIFDPFVQQPQALDRSKGGLGLGLAIVKSLVDLHGGKVSAFSAGRGEGSQFVVELPLSGDGEHPVMPMGFSSAKAGLRAPAGRNRVLVVDDNVDAAHTLADLLRSLGYEVAVAYDALAALELAGRVQPHACVLDIGLPVMDGYELARRFRDGPTGERLRLVAVTGYGQPGDRQRALQAGFDVHLVKPVNLEELGTSLARPADGSGCSAGG